MKTIEYYDNNAESFYDRTINTDLSEIYDKFAEYIPENAHILDAGCGVGRDSKYFLSKGYEVTAFDASIEMVKTAKEETGLDVLHIKFQDIEFEEVFDAAWAQLSLIHVPYSETREVYTKIHNALKPEGIFFASYKYGAGFMPNAERDFYNMDENTIKPYFEGLFDIVEIWTEKDTRSTQGRSKDGLLLNFIVRKVDG